MQNWPYKFRFVSHQSTPASRDNRRAQEQDIRSISLRPLIRLDLDHRAGKRLPRLTWARIKQELNFPPGKQQLEMSLPWDKRFAVCASAMASDESSSCIVRNYHPCRATEAKNVFGVDVEAATADGRWS